jgi:CYTH domain-containing protein
MADPKYALRENERRFLVSPDDCPPLGPSARLITDLYLDAGRLRLRMVMDEATGEREFKLCKKYPGSDPVSGAIVNIYLTEVEHEALARLPGAWLRKRRHRVDGFVVDRFLGPLEGLILCEAEAESRELVLKIQFPAWAGREVTDDPFFTGGSLSRAAASDLKARLAVNA